MLTRTSQGSVLDSGDVQRLLRCGRRTLYSYVRERGLKPRRRIGRELFFRLADVETCLRSNGRPKRGQPPKGGDDSA